jgi:glycosyltransferase involved in cell wall biosynthesis
MSEDVSQAVCVVSQPLSSAGESATAGLLEILSTLSTVSLVTPYLAPDSSLREHYEVVGLGEVGSGRAITVQAVRFLLNQARMCWAIHRRPEEIMLFFGATSYLLPILFARLVGKTVVLEPRGDVPLTLFLHWERRVPGPIARVLSGLVWLQEHVGFHAANAIITYTPSMVQQLGLEAFEHKLFTEGARFVDTDRFYPRLSFEQRGRVVGFLGRLDEEKGIRELATVARDLPEEVTFVFAGDGDLHPWLERDLADEVDTGDVELSGWVDHEDVPHVLSRFRLLVMPSQPTEGLPTVILEALACGTPVFATPVAGVPDVVRDGITGYHMTSREHSYLVERIARREGIGDTLAEGIHRVHDELGVGDWTVKGLDFAAHEGRLLHGQALSYAVANRGADHMYATFYSVEYPLVDAAEAMDPAGTAGKAERLVERENLMALNDSGVVCKFSRDYMTPERYEALFGADFEDLLAVGARTVTLERHFNNRRGFDRTDDALPYDIPDLERGLEEYYEARGWVDGVVPEEALPEDAAASAA